MKTSLETLEADAKHILNMLRPGDTATIIALSGDLGAGKTTFVQAIARSLGVEEDVTSPTFVLERTYELKGSPPCGGWKKLVHIDAYRLVSAEELLAIGWEDRVADPGNLILIEWPENVAALIPEGAIRIKFDIKGDERIIEIHGEEKGGQK